MLRRLEVKEQWRSFESGFWPDDRPLGRATVVYGHNGSGKSTLAELLLSLGEGQAATGVVWEKSDQAKVNVPAGGNSPSPAMAVFTRAWVQANLSEFLAGENADAIVTLGQEAIDSKETQKSLEEEIARLRSEAEDATALKKKLEQKASKLARDVQDRIVGELQRFDYNHYSRNRYSVVKVGEFLRIPRTDFPDDGAHADALVRLGEEAPAAVAEVASPPQALNDELKGLGTVLERTPTRVALAALEADPRAQSWVEQGLGLHEGRDNCLFCDSEVSAARRTQLAQHFDKSWLEIRGAAQQLHQVVTGRKRELKAWLGSMPDPSDLASDLQAVYRQAMEQARGDVDARVESLELVEAALTAKIDDPSAVPVEPEWKVLGTAVSATVLSEAVKDHNEQAKSYGELTEQRRTVVLDHIVGSQSQAFRDLEKQVTDAKESCDGTAKAVELASRNLDRVRQQQFTTKDMADKLTRDLARVYGKAHLSIAVTDDGKSYTCRRGDKAGTNLSEGERTTLSLLYFLRNLEDQQTHGIDPTQRIVVIDDPSSSLDREALFATHQWLFNTLQNFGQYVVLTHDFNLLRLFITSHRSKWSTSVKTQRDGDANEVRFPRVAFLEMFAATKEGKRTTKVGPLPDLLRNSTSEYAYLFSMVMKGVQDTEDHERLFLLPNAARRVLESFASYKAPHRPNFLQQLESLVVADPDEPYRDVFDFCNRFSHGEGSETVEVLDARAVHGQVRRCMEFLRAVDPDHFANMCKAVKVDSTVLA
ncbi:AAA family ATPase [Microbacterium oleivorans]|uniref:AAA family ATPase n=1 Tax=Microbacterium oleivorans TaxID=273677 RepID=UPI00076771AD|nr:AAA family ATPase [Microbacterium oleivorans]